MRQITDAIVIGSGIIGCAVSYALTRAGIRRVALVEKGPLVSGMTRRTAGLAHPYHGNSVLNELATASCLFYNQWAVHLGGKSAFVETGAVLIAESENPGLRVPQPLVPREHAEFKSSQPDALADQFPGLSSRLRAAAFTPRAGYADAVLAAQAFVNAGKDRGLQVHTGTLVKQIVVEHGRVRGIATTTGTIEAPTIIVAAGGWTERLLAPLGIALRVRFRRGAIFFFEQPRELTQGHPILLDGSNDFFLRPHPYRMSAAGFISNDVVPQAVEQFDEYIPPAQVQQVGKFVSACIPLFGNPVPKRGHAILYDAPADGLPALGRAGNFDGLFVAAGFGASAFSVAPAVGETLAQLVTEGSAAHEVVLLDPARVSLKQ